ncbi:hypothetical protein EBX93_14640 [bacterium]|nr:hypothetical protein [bacterium]
MGLIALNGSPLYREDDTCVAVWRSDMEKKPTELIVASKPMDCAPWGFFPLKKLISDLKLK